MKIFILQALIILQMTYSTIAQAPNANSVSYPYKLSRYDASGTTYDQAKTACIARNSWLVEIKNQQIQNAVTNLLSSLSAWQPYYIGATDLDEEGVWKWNDGTSVSYTNWNNGELTNGQGEDCSAATPKTGGWIDLSCTYQATGYICQSDLNPVVSVGRTEFTFFSYNDQGGELRLNRDNAQSYCEERESTLASIYNAEIDTALTEQIQILVDSGVARNWFYLSGKGSVSGGIRWGDGTIVPTRPTTGYHNWYEGEPNDSGESCIIKLSETGNRFGLWADVLCTNEVFFICQKNPVSLSPRQQVITAVKGDLINISLNVTTYDGPVSVRVYKEPDTNPLQTMDNIGNQTVSFQLGTANESHAGLYRFDASTDFAAYNASATAEITVNVRATITDISSLNIQVPVTTGPDHVTCTAYGIPTPAVQWIKDGAVVATSGTIVYQTMQTTTARLMIRNAKKSDAGIYTCRARNTVGGNQPDVSEERNITLTVYGAPTISNVEVINCSETGQFNVHWSPDGDTMNVNHRFTINNTDNKFRNVTPTTAIVTTDFTGLQPSTTYSILIEVCPDLCITALKNTTTTTTAGGLPSVVENAQINSTTCELSWSYPSATPIAEITGFKIEVTTTIRNSPDSTPQPNITVSKDLTYLIPTDPNRVYTAKIYARTCAGNGSASNATGSCTTQQSAPSVIPSPILQPTDEGAKTSRNVKLSIPDESNGQISCLIVIAYSGSGNSDKNGSYSYENLNNAQTAALENSAAPAAVEYIATVMPRPRANVTGSTIKVALGGGSEITSCNVSSIRTTNRRKRAIEQQGGVIQGKNFPLKNTEYSFYVVTATPLDDGSVLYAASSSISFSNIEITPPQARDNTGTIVGVVLAILAIIAIIIIIICIYRKKRKESIKRPQIESRPMDPMETAETLYANIDTDNDKKDSSTDIAIADFPTEYKKLKANDNAKFKTQYQELRALVKEKITLPTSVALLEALKKKNRYKNILPYDETRVILEGDDIDGYINANFISGYEQPHKFIATQGPLPQTVQEFWRMAVEQNCKVIVMLTKCMEGAKKKCEQYWPKKGITENHGGIDITNQEESRYGGYVRRIFRVTSLAKGEMLIHQFQYTKWPDHGVPITTSSFFRMHKDVMKAQSIGSTRPPIIVHCSAGAGRTGAFIGFDYLLEATQSKRMVDVFNCVFNMRHQRVDMVQNCDQYVLLHKLVLESYLYGDTDVDASELSKYYQQSFIEEEFNNITRMMLDSSLVDKDGEKNQHLNRNPDIIPYNHSKLVIVRQPHDTEKCYINASPIETYEESKLLIAAQGPLDADIENFWRAAYDSGVKIIIMLTKMKERGNEQCTQYWPAVDDTLKFKNMSVKLIEEHASPGIIERKIIVIRDNDSKIITQYHYLGWSSTTCPEDPDVVLNLASKLEFGQESNKQTVALVHCSDGAGRTGAFCAIVNLIERVKAENRVDVFRAVKDLRDCRPGMVQTLDEYRFCYEAAISYATNANLYANYTVSMPEEPPTNPIYENMSAVQT